MSKNSIPYNKLTIEERNEELRINIVDLLEINFKLSTKSTFLETEKKNLQNELKLLADKSIGDTNIVSRLEEEMKWRKEKLDSSNPPLHEEIFIIARHYQLLYKILHGTKSLKSNTT